MGPLANNGIQSSVSLFCHIRAYRKREREQSSKRERETVPPLDSQASAGLSQWQNGQFLCLCLFLSPAVSPRRVAIVSASSAGGQGCSLSLSLPTSLPSRGRGAGREQEARLQTVLVTPTRIRDTLRTHTHAHVHLLLFSRGIPGFLVNTVQVNRLPVWHSEIRSRRLYVLNSSLLNSNVLCLGQLLYIWSCSLVDFLIYLTPHCHILIFN